MSGTYLICDLCGKFGPPAGFFFKDGIRLCYECYFDAGIPAEKAERPAPDSARDKENPDDTVTVQPPLHRLR